MQAVINQAGTLSSNGLQPHLYTFLHNVLTIATLRHNIPVALYTELHLFEQVLFLIEQLMANY